MKSKSPKKTFFTGIKYIILVLFAILCLFPMIWLLFSSFKTNTELFENPWGLPSAIRFDNYIQAVTEGNILRYFGNSCIIAFVAVAIAVMLSTMVAFAVTRMKWKLSNFTMNLFLLGMMVPVYAMIIPLFTMFNSVHLLNTHAAVILPHISISFPMAIFILSGFMKSIPRELEEAAVIDGCNIYQVFRNVTIPISKSSMVTVAVVNFINIWNDLLLPQIFLTDSAKMTLPVGLTEFQGQYATNYVVEIAAVIVTVIPSVIVYIFLHKNIMEGMVAGAVKG